MTTLQQYQNLALKTAMPEAFRHDYLIPSIVGEVGECFGKRGKAVRDHWTPERLDDALVGEYGDVAWMVAVLLHMHDVHTLPKPFDRNPFVRDHWQPLLSHATTLYALHSLEASPTIIKHRAIMLWQALEAGSYTITGASFDLVLDYNIQKLASRRQRGVITGSGDNR